MNALPIDSTRTMPRRRILLASFASLGLISVLAMIAVVRINGHAALTREFYLHLLGTNVKSEREGRLIREFYNFAGDFGNVLFAADSAPTDMSRDGILRWMNYDDLSATQRILPHVVSGIDPWGYPLILDVQVNDLPIEIEVKGVIRSVGVNGRDEQGKGDDIQVNLGYRLFSVEETKAGGASTSKRVAAERL